MDDDQFTEVHLIKLKLANKNVPRINIICPFLQKFTPTVQLKAKSTIYVPLINKIIVSKDLISNAKWQQIPILIQPILEYPFDKHNIKVQTYDDEARTIKGQVINLQLQFSLFLTEKKQKNFVTLFFKHANLKKDPKLFGKMSPHVVILTEQKQYKTRQIKDGHMNPKFQEQIQITFNSVFDKIVIELKDGENRIGYNDLFIFELFGKNEERQMELKKERKIVGSLIYVVQDFQPQDF